MNTLEPSLPATVTRLLERLVQTTPLGESWMAEILTEGRPARELHRDPKHGFILMGHVHRGGHHNTPHDHGPCWVVYGVAHGEVEITKYRRRDDGSVPGKAALEEQERVRFTPGVVRPYLAGEIHSTRAVDSTASLVFRFLSADLDRVERYRYDVERGTVSRHVGG
jgi:predicted metal-dependent enzyme (double-stranded beta helix superfamily)